MRNAPEWPIAFFGIVRAGATAVPVDPALEPALELVRVEGEEVGALLALHVDDLDVLAGFHHIGRRRCRLDAMILQRIGERLVPIPASAVCR